MTISEPNKLERLKDLSEEEKLYVINRNVGTAFHEAGHAVTALLMGVDFEYVTIERDPETDAWGSIKTVKWSEDVLELDDWDPEIQKRSFAQIVHTLAGRIAEQMICDQVPWTWQVGGISDTNEVVEYALQYHHEEVERVIEQGREKAKVLLIKNWEAVKAVAWALIDRRYLKEVEVKEIIKEVQV